MILSTPSAPFERLKFFGESITLDVSDSNIVLSTGNPEILTMWNEYQNNSDLISPTTNPFRGLNGVYPPDYCTGTVLINSGDGIYLTDINGQNTTKTLTVGKLTELGNLTIDKTNHTITEEFIIQNNNTSNNTTVIDNCNFTTGWTVGASGSGTITVENGRIKFVGTADSNGKAEIYKAFSAILLNKQFMIYSIESTVSKNAKFSIVNSGVTWSKTWNDSRYLLVANLNTTIVLPVNTTVGSTGSLPNSVSGTMNTLDNVTLYIGINGLTSGQSITFYIDNISTDVGKSAYVEIQTPDNLSPNSLTIQNYNGSTYQTTGVHSLDSSYSNVSQITTNSVFLDGTKLDNVYGSGFGRSIFPKGISNQTVTGSSGTITYSSTKGTKNRIGLRIDLPPSDGGRTNFNKIRLKLTISYTGIDTNHIGSTTYEFENSTNASYGLQNLIYPWIALYNRANTYLDFFLFNDKPKNLNFKLDESGNIYEVTLYPENGLIYHGRLYHPVLTRDSNSNNIPDCLDISYNGSVTKFLEPYTFVKDWFTEIDLSASGITPNDFGITADSLDIIPYAVSSGDSVSDMYNNRLPAVETVTTSRGNISIVDVRGLSKIRVRNTPYTNSGDCKIWDTVTTGNTDESTWKRVYSTDWVFTGDAVFENGLIRLKFVTSSLILYSFNGSSYAQVSSNASYGTLSSISSIATDKITFITSGVTISIIMGLPYILTTSVLNLYSTSNRFIVTDDQIYDALADSSTHSVTVDSSSLYAIVLSPSASVIPFLVRYTAGGFSSSISGSLATSLEFTGTTLGRTGAISFDCSLLYSDSASMTGGSTI